MLHPSGLRQRGSSPRRWILTASAVLLAVTATASADPSYIYGMHDPGGEGLMGANKGWIVWTEAIGISGSGGGNYSSWSNAGYGVIVRLNNGYGSSGTIPYQSQYPQFASRCANYIQNSSGVDYWIIGNETNLPREWPGNVNGDPNTGEPITSARYISCYNQCYNAIKAVAPSAKLCPSPSGTWGPPYPAQGIEGFLDYWVNCLNGIGASKIEGLVIHTYTHGCDPALITSEQKMGPPYQDIYYHFRAYKNYMWAVPSSMTSKPMMITESDQNVECADGASPRHTWYNVNNGWMKAAFAEINTWNTYNSQKIRCLVMFRWPMAAEGEYTFGLQDRDQCQIDYQQAVAYGYQWGTAPPPPCDTGPGVPSGSNLSLTAATYIESGRNETYQYGKAALDGNTSTKWACNTSASGGTSSLAVDLGSNASVTGFVVRHAEEGGEPDYLNTEAFRVESGTSLNGPWTTQWTQDNSCQAAYNTFQFGSAQTIRYVRLVITDPGIDSWVRLPEFEVYGTSGASDTITVQAEDFQGGVNAANGTDYYDTSGGNSGGAYRSTDVDIESCTDGRYNVGWIASGEWLKYPIQGDGGDFVLSIRYASPYNSRTGHFELDGQNIGSFSVNATGGWQSWATAEVGTVNLGTGWKTLSIHMDSSSFNVARFWLEPGSGGGGPPTMNGNPPSGTNVATSSTQVAADSYYASGWEPVNAIDGVIGSGSGDKWVSNGNSPPHWIKIDLGEAKTVNGYKIHHAEAGGEPSYYNTQLFQVQVGDSYNGPWTTHADVDNSDQSDAVTNLSYDTPQQVRYVRVYITDAGIDNYVRLPELEVYADTGGGGGPLTVAEDFNSMPSWSSSFDAGWGSAASWSIVSGGQSGNALQASRSSQGSSAKVKVYDITASTNYTISVYIKCPSYSGTYWAECAYRLGNYSANDFDSNGSAWTMIKKFDSGANGNGNTWVQYSKTFNSGSNTQISVGYKLGSSGGGGPTVLWDTLRVD